MPPVLSVVVLDWSVWMIEHFDAIPLPVILLPLVFAILRGIRMASVSFVRYPLIFCHTSLF